MTPDPVIARVTSSHGDYFRVVSDAFAGEALARTKASVYRRNKREESVTMKKSAPLATPEPPTTGDWVKLVYNPAGESRIVDTLPRTSKFVRTDPSARGRGEQTVAANFDTLFFCMSLNANFSTARLERFAAAAEASGCRDRLVVLLTKTDLVAEKDEGFVKLFGEEASVDDFVEEVREAAPGLAVHALSARTGEGIGALAPYLAAGRTIAFVGSSGVGKSTLLNRLAGEEVAATGEIQADDKGRHTTTVRELVKLPSGVWAMDTPGLREIGLVGEADVRFANSGTHRFR